uniref:Uncharacterized protein n=1 Tax=Anguilla anguilla TaxID=7936 RepID=A0A0E9XYS7_ANGAN
MLFYPFCWQVWKVQAFSSSDTLVEQVLSEVTAS